MRNANTCLAPRLSCWSFGHSGRFSARPAGRALPGMFGLEEPDLALVTRPGDGACFVWSAGTALETYRRDFFNLLCNTAPRTPLRPCIRLWPAARRCSGRCARIARPASCGCSAAGEVGAARGMGPLGLMRSRCVQGTAKVRLPRAGGHLSAAGWTRRRRLCI